MTINELYGEAYNTALAEVIYLLSHKLGVSLNPLRVADANAVHELCEGLKIDFNNRGHIIN